MPCARPSAPRSRSTNGGGIRGDRTYPPGTVLTRKDILTELPFGNVIVLIELIGRRPAGGARERRLAGRGRRRALPAGLGPELPLRSEPARRQRGSSRSRSAAGRSTRDRVYKLATNEYVCGGGDGYAALARGKPIIDASAGTLMAGAVIDYIARQGAIAPKVEGRIARLR